MAYTPFSTTAAPADPPTRLDNIGTAGVAGDAGTGISFSNTGNETVIMHNSGAATPTFVILASGVFKGAPLDESNDITQACVASADYYIGRLDPDIYNNASGLVLIYFSGGNETDLKITAWRNG